MEYLGARAVKMPCTTSDTHSLPNCAFQYGTIRARGFQPEPVSALWRGGNPKTVEETRTRSLRRTVSGHSLVRILRQLTVHERDRERRQPSRGEALTTPRLSASLDTTLMTASRTAIRRTCQQSVMNSSQNSARRFCTSAGDSFHRAQSRSTRENREKKDSLRTNAHDMPGSLTQADLDVKARRRSRTNERTSERPRHPKEAHPPLTLCANFDAIPINAQVLSILCSFATKP